MKNLKSISKLLSLITINILIAISALGQTTQYKITGKIIDSESKQPLSNVSVQIDSTNGTLSNSNGIFEIEYYKTVIVININVQRVGYEKKQLSIEKENSKDLLIELTKKIKKLPEVEITGDIPEKITSNTNCNVLDYEFYNDNILLITYLLDRSKTKLTLIDQNLDTLASLNIPERPLRLFKDCFGSCHVICSENSYQVDYSLNSLRLLTPVETKKMEALLFPCIAQDANNLYFEQRIGSHKEDLGIFRITTNNLIVNYYYVNKKDRLKRPIASITDKRILEMSANEISYEQVKIDAGIYKAGSLAQNFERIFAEQRIFIEIFSPLYTINDTVYLFDCADSKLTTFSPIENKTNEYKINFNSEKDWNREIYVDKTEKKIYTSFKSKGVIKLKEIDYHSGNTMTQTYPIPYPFVEKIKAHEGYIYYLYVENEDFKTTFLSRQKIN